MRLLVGIIVIVTLVILDQYRFRGFYSAEVSRLIELALRTWM
jgi:hypothetical protein